MLKIVNLTDYKTILPTTRCQLYGPPTSNHFLLYVTHIGNINIPSAEFGKQIESP